MAYSTDVNSSTNPSKTKDRMFKSTLFSNPLDLPKKLNKFKSTEWGSDGENLSNRHYSFHKGDF